LSPSSLPEAVALLGRYGAGAKLIAGGTDLMVLLKEKRIAPETIINLLGVPELQGIEKKDEVLRIGATVRLSALERSPLLSREWSILASAAHSIGSPQIRNLGTIGGNLCNASPAADLAPSLLVMDAEVTLVSKGGERKVPLSAFFTGPGRTVLKKDEILKEITIPNPSPGTVGAYLKLGRRRSMDLSVVSVGVLLKLSGAGQCERVRIALGSVSPTPMRAKKAEKVLQGRRPDAILVREASECASGECRPITDIRGSAEYRVEMVKALVERAVKQSAAGGM